MSLNDALHWRYAPKRMNGKEVSEDQIEAILKAAQYAPTSMGLQPFKMVLIKDNELREQILPIAYNQAQIIESSHLLIFCAYTKLTEQNIEDYIQNIMKIRSVSRESLAPFFNSMIKFVNNQSDDQITHWSSNQTYIALGFALAEAALLGVDITPMEGFNSKSLDKMFDFQKNNLTSIAILAIGYRDVEQDFLANEKKVRRSIEDLVTRY
jgi:nitroreductase